MGKAHTYNRNYDRLESKQKMPLKASGDYFYLGSSYMPADDKTFSTTSSDPVMEGYIANNDADIYITDTILSTIMTQTRSIFSWDIVIKKTDNGLVFDKRNHSTLEAYVLNENTDYLDDDEIGMANLKETAA
jgi:translation initiation factor 3 subunit D